MTLTITMNINNKGIINPSDVDQIMTLIETNLIAGTAIMSVNNDTLILAPNSRYDTNGDVNGRIL